MDSAIKKISDAAEPDLSKMGWTFEALADGDPQKANDPGVAFWRNQKNHILKLIVDKMWPAGAHPLDDIRGLYIEIYSNREESGNLNPKDCFHRNGFAYDLIPSQIEKNLKPAVQALLSDLKKLSY